MADFGIASAPLSKWCLNIRFLVHSLEASSRDSFAQTLEVPSADPNTKISSLKAQHVMRLECALVKPLCSLRSNRQEKLVHVRVAAFRKRHPER